jgi:hypothetical protein
MLRFGKPFTGFRDLVGEARAIARGFDVLYHGTRHPQSVLRTNMLLSSYPGTAQVSFTRSADVAAHFASLERDYDEDEGAILVLDRSSLRCRYRLEPRHDPIWDTPEIQWDEMEECVWSRNVDDLHRHLLGVVLFRGRKRSSARKKKANDRYQLQTRLRMAGLEPAVAFEIAYILRPVGPSMEKKLARLRRELKLRDGG